MNKNGLSLTNYDNFDDSSRAGTRGPNNFGFKQRYIYIPDR